jgi:hypothetical protein
VVASLVPVIIWAIYKHQKPKYVLKWFFNYKVFTFATLFSLMALVAGALVKNYTHYSTILFAGGMVSFLMCLGIVEPMLHKKPNGAKQEPPKPVVITKFWSGLGLLAGTFAIVAAWNLFPIITTIEGWITFFMLILIGLTFMLRAIIAFNFHIWLPTAVASWAATNGSGWITPLTGGMLSAHAILWITIIMTAIFWAFLTIILIYLYHLQRFLHSILNSAPFLGLTAMMALSWAGLMAGLAWSL